MKILFYYRALGPSPLLQYNNAWSISFIVKILVPVPNIIRLTTKKKINSFYWLSSSGYPPYPILSFTHPPININFQAQSPNWISADAFLHISYLHTSQLFKMHETVCTIVCFYVVEIKYCHKTFDVVFIHNVIEG